MGAFRNLIGQRFGRLVVIASSHVDEHRNTYWLCQCDCTKEKIVFGGSLQRGATQSCGCLWREAITVHGNATGMRNGEKCSREYSSWRAMLQRCYNPKAPSFKYYGGHGITDRWPNPNGNYEPGNCRWATAKEQRANWRARG